MILVDNKTLQDSGVKENSFIVLMVKAPAAAGAPAPTATAPAPSNTNAPPPAAVAAPTPVPKPVVAPAPSPAAAVDDGGVKPMDTGDDSVANAESTLLTNQQQIESTIQQLCEMGFPREDVVKALRAAFNNPNRAVDYLMSGHIPDVQAPPPAAARPGPGPAAAGASGGGAPGRPVNLFEAADRTRQGGGGGGAGAGAGGGEGGENIFDFLRHNPQFNALRFMVQQNPALLQPILGQLGNANPELLQLITQHQEEFTQLLNEPVDEADLPQMGPGGPGGAGGGGRPGVTQIALTQDEKDAVDRLMSLGFSQQAVLEAYLACDKNEQLAANYLLENGMDLGGDEGGFEEEGGDYDDYEEGGDM